MVEFLTIYRIYNQETGLYSKGGSGGFVGWSKYGKIWTTKHHLIQHFKYWERYTDLRKRYKDCVIVVQGKEIQEIPVEEFLDEIGIEK